MKNKTRVRLIIICLVIFAFSFALVPNTIAATITVPNDYSTIQAAINAANNGDTVYVNSQTYYENITIDKSITLQGENKETTVIDGSGSGNVVYSMVGNVVINGFTIRNGNKGIYFYNAGGSKITNCILTHNYEHGMGIYYSPWLEIRECEISDTYATGDVYKGIAIWLWGSSNSIIEDTRIFDNESAARAFMPYHSNNTTIRNIEMFNNNGGLYAGFGSYHMEKLNIHDNGGGVTFNGASYGSLKDSIIRFVSGRSLTLIHYSSNNIIEGNVFESNETGIYFSSSVGSSNRFFHNDIIDNTLQVVDNFNVAIKQYWDNGYPSGGNFWSDYLGDDNYSGVNQDVPGSDGIGDEPYWITESAKDNYPLMRPFNITNTLPTAVAGTDQTVEQESYDGTEVILDGTGSTDPDSTPGANDDIVSYDWYEGDIFLGSGEFINYTFTLGEHNITLVVTDTHGETDDDEVIIIVQDTTPPEITMSIEQDILWPPNHKMVNVGFSFEVSDMGDTDPIILIQVTSDEPTTTSSGAGGSKHTPDAKVTDDDKVSLRAERSGKGDGRVYQITLTASDLSNNSSARSLSVKVNHNKKKDAVDSGQNYDATKIN